jgi:hypothetical protein
MPAYPKSTEKPSARPPMPPGERFRMEIEKAVQDGADLEGLVLRLTLGDVSRLKRDPTISTADISFSGGEMRYLGVKVASGDTQASSLVISQS